MGWTSRCACCCCCPQPSPCAPCVHAPHVQSPAAHVPMCISHKPSKWCAPNKSYTPSTCAKSPCWMGEGDGITAPQIGSLHTIPTQVQAPIPPHLLHTCRSPTLSIPFPLEAVTPPPPRSLPVAPAATRRRCLGPASSPAATLSPLLPPNRTCSHPSSSSRPSISSCCAALLPPATQNLEVARVSFVIYEGDVGKSGQAGESVRIA